MSFDTVSKKMAAKQHIPLKNAKAELAWSSRHASAEAVRKNPALLKVKRATHR